MQMKNVAYIPSLDENIISETQFRRIQGNDIGLDWIDWRGMEILPDIVDNLYYFDIRPVDKKPYIVRRGSAIGRSSNERSSAIGRSSNERSSAIGRSSKGRSDLF
jgi:hypothetical protein